MWKPDYVTLEEFKGFLRINDSLDDEVLAFAITASSRAIDKAANRQFGNVEPEARQYMSNWSPVDRKHVVNVDDLHTLTDLVVTADGVTLTALDYTFGPGNAFLLDEPYTFIDTDIQADSWVITGRWGWAQVPTAIKQATLIQASRFLKRRDSPFGVAGSPDTGSELRLLNKLDPDVALIVSGFKKWWALV